MTRSLDCHQVQSSLAALQVFFEMFMITGDLASVHPWSAISHFLHGIFGHDSIVNKPLSHHEIAHRVRVSVVNHDSRSTILYDCLEKSLQLVVLIEIVVVNSVTATRPFFLSHMIVDIECLFHRFQIQIVVHGTA